MRAMGRPSMDGKSRKVTPPSPSYMSNDQFASYLSDLRNNRMARPGGARPQPASSRPAPPTRTSTGRYSSETASSHSGSMSSRRPAQQQQQPQQQRGPSQAASSMAAGSVSSRYSMGSANGRDYYPEKSTRAPLKPSEVVPSATYIERGQRWMEKEEAYSLRDAMEEMDIRSGRGSKGSSSSASRSASGSGSASEEEDTRIYNAALDEAAELVWQHQHGGPAPASRPDGAYRYRPHLRKNSYAHARTASVGQYGMDIAPTGLARNSGYRSVSGSSSGSNGSSRSRPSMDNSHVGQASSSRPAKPYGSVGVASKSRQASEGRRRSSAKRNISGEVDAPPFSGDQIWEEPETSSNAGTARVRGSSPQAAALGSKSQNPVNRVRFESSSREDLSATSKPHNRVEIHRNPPSRSRNAQYTTNAPSPGSGSGAAPAAGSPDDGVERKNGVEIRSQDIRDATSMRMRDRSPRLPEPTAVSDSPGRPIVSFNANWRAPEPSTDYNLDRQNHRTNASPASAAAAPSSPVELASSQRPRPSGSSQRVVVPSISVEADDDAPRPKPRAPNGPPIPTISIGGLADEPNDGPTVPSINIPVIAVDEAPSPATPSIPIIVAPDDSSSAQSSSRPLPTPRASVPAGQRKAQRPRGHWSPAPGTSSRVTAICHECGFPIEGRFVALRGTQERFHPQCFQCYSCGTSLEAMEISPEPDAVRSQRLQRIRQRAAGEILEEIPGMTMGEDGDERLRFYCHLDWHELFAPRCKHCKTPILGEHIVALGEHWHYGHFFCAECGDPFEHGMTHIEKDGYAWCINCQTKRTERRAPKCKKCRTAVIGQYVQALGGEWHDHCFRCAECRGGFDDGQIFPKEVDGGTVVLCTACRAMELKF